MNCIIPGSNMKVLHKAIVALSKISDEIYIEAKQEAFAFLATNSNKTAFVKYNFNSFFFTSYEAQVDVDATNGHGVTCKIYIKCLINVFKATMDRKLESCRIQLEKDATKMLFHLNYKNDVRIKHKLNLMDFDYINIDYDRDDAINRICASGHVLNQVLNKFQASDSTLSLLVKRDDINFKNYNIGVDGIFKGMRSQVTLTRAEFAEYAINEETSIVVSMKPFRSMVSFGEQFNLNVVLNFKVGGCPIIMCVKSATFDVDYILSTVSPDGSSQSTAAVQSISTKSNDNRIDVTVQDQEAMQSVNWDNDEFSEETPIRCSFTNVLKQLQTNTPTTPTNDAPESPVMKKAKVFERCFDPTFHKSMFNFGDVLAENSDSDID